MTYGLAYYFYQLTYTTVDANGTMIATYAAATVFAYGALSDLIGKAILFFSYAGEDYSYPKVDGEGKAENDAVTPDLSPVVPVTPPFNFEAEEQDNDPFAVDDFSFDFGGPSIPEPVLPEPEEDPFALDF